MKKGAPGCLGYVGDDVLHTYESLLNNQDSMESIREFFRGLEHCVVFFFWFGLGAHISFTPDILKHRIFNGFVAGFLSPKLASKFPPRIFAVANSP